MTLFLDIIAIALLCIVLGGASIPIAFNITDDPVTVWAGNALGSVISAVAVIIIMNKLTNKNNEEKLKKKKFTRKIVTVFEEGDDNKKVKKATIMINKHGLRIFSLFCPVFPGVLFSTIAVYILELDKKLYLRWMPIGVVLVSGFYVFSYWLAFVRN